MPEQKKPTTNKPKVPNTEISIAQDASSRNYIIIMVAVSIVIVFVGGYFITNLTNQYIHQSNVNKAQDKTIGALDTTQSNLKALRPNYDAITTKGASGVSDSNLILNALPEKPDYEGLIAILEKMGQNAGVKVSTISQSSTAAPTAAKAGAIAVPFTITVEGSYNSVLEFLKETEKSSRVINFNSMSLSSSGGTLSASISMTTYYKSPANISNTMEPLK